jgi:chromosome segregation protein
MHISRLRLIGFKSFVEPTELLVETGLTGVVGPNGCGKSNLLEALRWVMGETSYKSMRASAMDDVIFSGTNGRPARNMAEVTIFIDNADRQAPAEFNDNDHIEITRRIERESGSAYRVNGREVRARDVKILFEDAATGARSPALVRQGQIGEIVNAKPEQRRRILEDAAGTAGLHSRRHEAELRLKGAEANLVRIGDVVGQLKSQIESLKRQARQARRYSELSEDIRKAEALLLFLTWSAQQGQVDHDEAALQVALEGLGAATAREAEATKRDAQLADTLQPLRDEEVTRAAVLARLQHAQNNLDNELRRAQQRKAELEARLSQLETDAQRERELVEEAGQQCARLNEEREALAAEGGQDEARDAGLKADLEAAERELDGREKALAEMVSRQAELRSTRFGAEARLKDRLNQQQRLANQRGQAEKQIAAVSAAAPDAEKLFALQGQSGALNAGLAKVDEDMVLAETAVVETQARLREAQGRRQQAQLDVNQIETERRTLERLVQTTAGDAPAIVDQISVSKGFENALGAALGDDLEAPIASADVVHWRRLEGGEAGAELSATASSFPEGTEPLARFVSGPPEIAARLAHIAVVDAASGAELQRRLRPGLRIVSREGGLWRWDGLVAPAGAPTAAAQRLAGRNRLRELQAGEADARERLAGTTAELAAAERAARDAQANDQALRQMRRETQAKLTALGKTLADMEQAARQTEARLGALREALAETAGQAAQADAAVVEAKSELDGLPLADHLDAPLEAARADAALQRTRVAELKAQISTMERERARRTEQERRLAADIARWTERAASGKAQMVALEAREQETAGELKTVSAYPQEVASQRQRLLNELADAEAARRDAADRLAAAEAALKEAGTVLRQAQADVSEQREIRARAEARLEAARGRRAEIVRAIEEGFETTPEGLRAITDLAEEAALPELGAAEGRLQRLRADRDRLGGVNLQAGEELDALTAEYTRLDGERADVEEAISKLRAGIANLNREGRKRLKDAFETVDAHFQSLFTTLFGGGEAKLEMIDDTEDPLAGGLEIVARPPGKKPTTLSLLSGGEQTLTALSLIFAVFLTNPSPICVLDEVDAPLDDANVDRFCTLMEKMARDTDTRFLVITHHPMTMARMDRLFGVTMVERGVSQLVSVDLAAAESILEAS